MLNNFFHDFSAAGWLFGSVLLWLILRKKVSGDEAKNIVADIVKMVMFLMRLSLLGIIVFGLIRTAAYRSYEWNDAAGQSQVTLLVVKHVVFTVIFVLGLIEYIRAGRFIKKILQ